MAKIEKFDELSQVCGFTIDGSDSMTIDYSPYNNTVYSNSLEEIIKGIVSREARPIITEYKCHNCGGSLGIPNDKHVMVCPYCNSVYAYGLQMINDKG